MRTWCSKRSVVALLLALCMVVAACDGDSEDVEEGPEASEDEGTEGPGTEGPDEATDATDAMEEGRGPTLESLSVETVPMGQVGPVLQTAEEAGQGAVTFTDVGTELGYAHQRPARFERAVEFFEASVDEPVDAMEAAIWPADPYGATGVAIFDADTDGDLDIYVGNGQGAANSLYLNQLQEAGTLDFTEGAAAAGVAATDSETTGVCAGDTDNDGDADLFVVGNPTPDQLFLNDGSGTFSPAPLPAGDPIGGSTCALGDVTGDGRLDIAVGRTFDHATTVPLIGEPFAQNLHNQLLIQQPDGGFVDEAAERGLHTLAGVPEGAAGVSWGVSLVDYDADGDLDLIESDDQATIPNSSYGGVDRGLLQVFRNDGSGNFTAIDAGTLIPGTWMGTAFADLNCDGNLDMLGANFGDYGFPTLGNPYTLGDYSTRWLLGDGDGGFSDPGVGDLGATHYAWGGLAEDFDNDGDADLLFQGGVDLGLLIELSNPGMYLVNEGCSADFAWQQDAFDVNHSSRVVTGTAAGDLDEDGFVDVVTVSVLDVPEAFPVFPMMAEYGAVTDGTAFFAGRFMPTGDGRFTYLGQEFAPGTLTVERNGGNANGAVAVRPVGAVGLTDEAVVPRSGFGAIVTIIPEGGQPFIKPLQGGGGYLSTDSPIINAGLGDAESATVEVQWPGGVRNRFYDVAAGEALLAPEIPCSFLEDEVTTTEYTACVSGALTDLVAAEVIDDAMAETLLEDAIRARDEG